MFLLKFHSRPLKIAAGNASNQVKIVHESISNWILWNILSNEKSVNEEMFCDTSKTREKFQFSLIILHFVLFSTNYERFEWWDWFRGFPNLNSDCFIREVLIFLQNHKKGRFSIISFCWRVFLLTPTVIFGGIRELNGIFLILCNQLKLRKFASSEFYWPAFIRSNSPWVLASLFWTTVHFVHKNAHLLRLWSRTRPRKTVQRVICIRINARLHT